MTSETTYWKADGPTSKRIIELVGEWDKVMSEAKALAKSIGANQKDIYTCNVFSVKYVSGFIFADPSKVDPKKFVRLKNTIDGWKPRARTDLDKQMKALRSDCVGDIMNLIGMKMFGSGLTVRTPGVKVAGKTAYLVVPSGVHPKGCTRISDVDFENLIRRKKKTGVQK